MDFQQQSTLSKEVTEILSRIKYMNGIFKMRNKIEDKIC